MKITELVKDSSIILNLQATSKQQVLEEISQFTADRSNLNKVKILDVLKERENICSTALDDGVAVAHGDLPGLNRIICTIARSSKGIDFDSLDDKAIHIFILMLSPEKSSRLHIQALSVISRVFKNMSLQEGILKDNSEDEVYNLIIKENDQ